MNNALPADLLKLKAQFESWRRTRLKKGPIPERLRRSAIALLDRHSAKMICEVCRLHPRTLQEPSPPKASPKIAANSSLDFFPLHQALPTADLLPHSLSLQSPCQMLLERPDGARLTITLPSLDAASLSTLCADFLRSSNS